jgi:hypothetical protein
VHVIAFDTEMYHFHNSETLQKEMEAWLRADLATANANRRNVPWIVAMGHRPL